MKLKRPDPTKAVVVGDCGIVSSEFDEYLTHCTNIATILAHASCDSASSRKIERYLRITGAHLDGV